MAQQVSFLYSGSAGFMARRTLIGDVLETRTRRDGGTDFLVQTEGLPFPKWINAEFCTDVPAEVVSVQAAVERVLEAVAEVEQAQNVPLWTPRKWLITSAAARARRLHLDGYMALEEVVAEWRQQQRFTAACAYYAGVNDRAHTRLIGDVERHAGIEKATVSAA